MSLLQDLKIHSAGITRRLTEFACRLHRCERGDIPIGQIVMIALVVIPLLLVLFFFRNAATDLINQWWTKITGDTATTGTCTPSATNPC